MTVRARRGVLALMTIAFAAGWTHAPAAHGATFKIHYESRVDGYFVEYTAGNGEANDVRVNVTASGLTLSDPLKAIVPADAETLSTCVIVPGSVTCPTLTPRVGGFNMGISLGDRDDRASVTGVHQSQMAGDSGRDVLLGSAAWDTLVGDSGADELVGGDGMDTAAYSGLVGVRVALDDIANDGAPGEGDNVHSDIEGIYGTDADDELIGSPANNFLSGERGADLLIGAGGDDRLFGWYGDDTLDGGPGADVAEGWVGNDIVIGGPGRDVLRGDHGDDQIRSSDGEPDDVVCGDGSDALFADAFDVAPPDCETVVLG